ncbi:glycosyltransferase [Candidatus Neomarinimicrobiota bacterium]
MIKIFIGTSAHNWDDIRILRKEAVSLVKEYQVELHAPAPFEYREYEGIKIYGLPGWEKVSDRGKIRKELRRRLKESDADIFHFHDPELILLGLSAKLFYRKQVIYDIHEDYPSYILHKSWIIKPMRGLIAACLRCLERLAGRIFNHLITTSTAINDRFAHYPSTIIANYPRLLLNGNFPEKPEGTVAFVYAGSMEDIRGIRELGHAFIKASDRSSVKMKLNIAGPIRGSVEFKNDMLTIFNHPLIEYHGVLEFEKAMELMNCCHVGLIPFLPVASNQNIVPHKLFDYMVAGLAVMATDYPGWPQELTDGKIGILFNPNDLDATVEHLLAVAGEPQQLQQMGRYAFELVREQFSWDSQEEKLLHVYESFA